MDAVIAVFPHHQAADVAVRRLVAAGCDKANLSVVGRGCHTAEDAVGIATKGERIRFWGPRSEFWGGLWGLLFGGLFLTLPGMGIVIVLGYLAATTMLAVEDVTDPNGFNVIALLAGLGVPSGVAVRYEAALKKDGILVVAHGSPDEVARAEKVLSAARPLILDTHAGLHARDPHKAAAAATLADRDSAPDRAGIAMTPDPIPSLIMRLSEV